MIKRKDPCLPFKVIPQTDERFISITYGQLGLLDSMNFIKISPDTVVKPLDLDEFVQSKTVLREEWEIFLCKTGSSL